MRQKTLLGIPAVVDHVIEIKQYFKHLKPQDIRTQRQAIIERAKQLFENGAYYVSYGDFNDLVPPDRSNQSIYRAIRKLREVGLFDWYGKEKSGKFKFSEDALRELKVKAARG